MGTDDDTPTRLRTLPDWLPRNPGDFYGICGLGPRGPAAVLGKYFGAVKTVIIRVRMACEVILQAKFARHEPNGCVRRRRKRFCEDTDIKFKLARDTRANNFFLPLEGHLKVFGRDRDSGRAKFRDDQPLGVVIGRCCR